MQGETGDGSLSLITVSLFFDVSFLGHVFFYTFKEKKFMSPNDVTEGDSRERSGDTKYTYFFFER